MHYLVRFFYLMATICLANFAHATEDYSLFTAQNELFMIGGGLEACSSFTPEHCTTIDFPRYAGSSYEYQITTETIKQLSQLAHWRNNPPNFLPQLQQALTQQLPLWPEKITQQVFDSWLKETQLTKDQTAWQLLDFKNYTALTSWFQTPYRLKEYTNLKYSQSAVTSKIFHYLAQIGQEKTPHRPRVGVVTASSYDPFDVVRFYQHIFIQAGAQFSWLPVDRFFAQAHAEQQCEKIGKLQAQEGLYRRSVVYAPLAAKQRKLCRDPELLLKELSTIDILWLSEGDQRYARQAFFVDNKPTPLLLAIRERVNQGKLIIAGTSAGTAALTGQNKLPMMIDEGMEKTLAYDPQGGLGLFTLGITDTHFSENDRQARLLLLAQKTAAPLAFGIDEKTALHIWQQGGVHHWQVIGQGGVWIVDRQQTPQRIHYLTDGDSGYLQQGQLQLSLTKATTQPNKVKKGQFKQFMQQHCQAQSISFQENTTNLAIAFDQKSKIKFNSYGLCHYTNMLLSFDTH